MIPSGFHRTKAGFKARVTGIRLIGGDWVHVGAAYLNGAWHMVGWFLSGDSRADPQLDIDVPKAEPTFKFEAPDNVIRPAQFQRSQIPV